MHSKLFFYPETRQLWADTDNMKRILPAKKNEKN